MLSESVRIEVERACSLETQAEMTDMEFFDMLMLNELQDAQTLVDEQVELAVQGTSMDRQVEQISSSEPQLEAMLASSRRHVERLCSYDAQQDESSGVMTGMDDLSAEDSAMIQSFIDMLMPELDADTQDSGQGDTLGMHVICSGHEETLQVSELECHDFQVRGEVASSPEIIDCLEWSFESDLTGLVRLGEIARVASAFGSLMYDLLVSRPKIAACSGSY